MREREVLLAITSLGGSRDTCKRERKVAFNAILSEVYIPPRIAAAAKLLPSLKILPGASLDLTANQEAGTSCGFDIKANRDKARALHEEQQPAFLVGSVVCTDYSQLQAINELRRDPQVVARMGTRAMAHLRFTCQLCQMQQGEGRYFLH